MFSIIAKLLKVLNSNDSPAQLALALCFAAFLGLTPLSSPHNFFLLFFLLILRINLSMFFLSWAAFTLLAYLLDPVSHILGLMLLQTESLEGVWQSLYNSNIWRVLAFNNSLVLGSFLISLILCLPIFFIGRVLVAQYRNRLLKWISQSRLALWLKGGKIFTAYQDLQG